MERGVVELQAARELLPELNLFSILKLCMQELFSLRRLDLNVDLVLALLNKPVVVFEVKVDFSSKLRSVAIECFAEVLNV